MRTLSWADEKITQHSHKALLVKCALVAFAFEALFLTGIAWQEHWLAHPQKTTGQDESRFIEAQVYEVPTEAHLVEEKKVQPSAPKPESVLSRVAGGGKAQKQTSPVSEENVTESGPKVASTHGPVAVYAPAPVIPSYLQDQELRSHVIIDFYVNSQGTATPRLAGSSGNDELDAIALKAVSQWQFRPAEKDGKAIESKVRLRIVFEVK